MIHLLTAADYRQGMAPVRPSRRAMASVHRTGPIALTLVLLLASAGVAFGAQDVVITTSGDRLVGEIKKVKRRADLLDRLLLLSADPVGKSLDPGYTFRF